MLRSAVRRYGLQWAAEPIVSALEQFRLRRFGQYDAHIISPGMVEIETRTRSHHLADLNEEFCALATSRHERPTMTAALSCVDQGMIVWDVGANIGFYSRLMAHLAGATGTVFSLEPNLRPFRS